MSRLSARLSRTSFITTPLPCSTGAGTRRCATVGRVMSEAHPVPEVLWSPPADARERSRMGRYLGWLAAERGLAFDGYDDAWRWSVDEPGAFWQSVWDHFGVRSATAPGPALAEARMPGARWFPDAAINYAEHALSMPGRSPDDVVVIGRSQTRDDRGPHRGRAARRRRALPGRARSASASRRGDRVAAFLPNVPEAIIGLLATASLGAIWSSCAPEFGTKAVVDRFAQIEPTVLLAVDGYRYGDRDDRPGGGRRRDPRRAADRSRPTVVVPYLRPETDAVDGRSRRASPGRRSLADAATLAFDPVPFDHPLYVLFSSGTTGLPKPIVHGHGGILLEHLKALALHTDLGPDDRFCWFTTTGWMMWNYLVSGLAVGSSVVLFDGNPAWPDLSTLWRLAAETRTHLPRRQRPVPDGLPGGRPGARQGPGPRRRCAASDRRARRCRRRGSGGSPSTSRTPSRSGR